MKKTYSAISNLDVLAVLALLAVSMVSRAGTITGQITTAANGAIANGTLTLTLSQYAVVSGTAAIAPAAVNCYTDSVGNVVGLPNPLAAPVLSVNLGSGSLPSGTYYVVYAWSNSTGTTFYSPESSILLTGAGTLIVAVPASPPASATNWKIFIGTTSLGETQQISQGTPFSNYSQATALSAGAALPGSNTSACSLRFNDELVPSFTKYNVSLKTQSGATVSGFPMFWQLFGGNAGTINVSNGFPLASNAVVYPFPIVSNPNAQSTQSINGGLNLNNSPISNVGTLALAPSANGVDIISGVRFTDSSPTGNFVNFKSAALSTLFKIDILGNMTAASVNNACNANQQAGADLGAKINACLAVANVSEIDITASGTISTQVVINNHNDLLIRGVGGYLGIGITNGITGNPAACAIKITGASQRIVFEDLNLAGNSLSGASGNGNGVCIYGTGGTPSQITFVRFQSQFQQGNGIDGTGASMPAAGLYFYQTNTIQVYDGAYGANQVGIEMDGGGGHTANLITVSYALISGDLTSGLIGKNGINHITIGPGNDIINNGTGTSAKWSNLDGCGQYCTFYGNYIESNNGLAAFSDAQSPGVWDISWNHWLVGAGSNTSFILDSSGGVDLDIHDNWITSAISVGSFIDFNPSASAGKVVRNNTFDFQFSSADTVLNAINWQAGTQSGKCVIENNTFGSTLFPNFTGTTAVDISANASGCRVQNNSCNTAAGTLTNCVKVESGATNTYVANTTTSGAGTITNTVNDLGTTTTCLGEGCSSGGTLFVNTVKPDSGQNITITGTASGSSGTFLGSSQAFFVNDVNGKAAIYHGVFTAGEGVAAVYGATSQKAETASADTNVLTLTPPASTGTYRVCATISVSSATNGVISWTFSWTDSNGNAQSNVAMPLFQFGTAAPNTTFTTSAAGNYTGCSTVDINNAAANIVVKWVGGGTTAAKMSAMIERLQ